MERNIWRLFLVIILLQGTVTESAEGYPNVSNILTREMSGH